MNKTPETDKIIRNAKIADHPPTRLAATLTVKCEKLERERDEAREAFVIATDQMVVAQCKLRESNKERDEWAAMCGRYKQERDELREKYDNLATKHMLAINKICNERDEAREAIRALAEHGESEIQRITNERDEARELVKAYQEYVKLLGDEINDMTAVVYVHGWRTNRYEEGKVLRDKIKQLEESK